MPIHVPVSDSAPSPTLSASAPSPHLHCYISHPYTHLLSPSPSLFHLHLSPAPAPNPNPIPISCLHLPPCPHQSLLHLLSPAPSSVPSPPVPCPSVHPHPYPHPHPHPVPTSPLPHLPPRPSRTPGRVREAPPAGRSPRPAPGGAASPSSIPAALKRRRRGRGAGTMSGRVGELSPRQAEALAQVRPAPGGRRGVLRCARLGRGVRGGPRAARRRDRGAITSGTRQQRDGGRRPAGHREARWHSFASPSTASIPRALLAPRSRHGARHTEVPQDGDIAGCVPCLPRPTALPSCSNVT
mgnify:CR=1 FL=1